MRPLRELKRVVCPDALTMKLMAMNGRRWSDGAWWMDHVWVAVAATSRDERQKWKSIYAITALQFGGEPTSFYNVCGFGCHLCHSVCVRSDGVPVACRPPGKREIVQATFSLRRALFGQRRTETITELNYRYHPHWQLEEHHHSSARQSQIAPTTQRWISLRIGGRARIPVLPPRTRSDRPFILGGLVTDRQTGRHFAWIGSTIRQVKSSQALHWIVVLKIVQD